MVCEGGVGVRELDVGFFVLVSCGEGGGIGGEPVGAHFGEV